MQEEEKKLPMKNLIILILIAIFTYWGLNNYQIIFNIVNTIFKVFFPFLLGGVFAFILNIPMSKIERLFSKLAKGRRSKKIVRIISIILSILFFASIIGIVSFLLIPELVENIESLMDVIPTIIGNIETFFLELVDKYPELQVEMENTFNNMQNANGIISNILNYIINGAIGFIGSLISGFITLFTALVFSIYMLSQKEHLIRIFKKILYASCKRKNANYISKVLALTNKTFNNFISGQCVDAIILGCIIFIASLIFEFPYAIIISVLTSITALIPIFGALIAMVVGAILIVITDPFQALIFIIVFLVVQQLEENFIYPRVVGGSVGLAPIWALLAITVGGSLFGIIGMLVGLPLASVTYAIISGNVNNRLKEKEIEIS